MNILFTLCGRAGSKGCKNKNISSLHGVPLIRYPIAAIKLYKDAHPENNVMTALNTDSIDLQKQVATQPILDGIISVPRKPELADSVSAKVDVIKDTYLRVKEETGLNFDAVIDLDITSPIRRLKDIENIIAEYNSRPEYDLAFTVVPARRNPYFNMVRATEDGFYKKVCSSNYTARQQAPAIFDLNASIYIFGSAFLDSEIKKSISEYKCGIVVMPDYLVLDIDSEEDLEMMNYLYDHFVERDPELNRIYNIARTNVR